MSYRFALLVALAVLVFAGAFGAAHQVSAQSAPPGLPTLYYGEISNGVAGAEVSAYVVDGSAVTKCGTGTTTQEAGKIVYAVDVAGDSQTVGCGKAGRQVKLTFKSPGEPVARPATQNTSWVAIGAGYKGVRFDVTLGAPPAIARRASVPGLSRNP